VVAGGVGEARRALLQLLREQGQEVGHFRVELLRFREVFELGVLH